MASHLHYLLAESGTHLLWKVGLWEHGTGAGEGLQGHATGQEGSVCLGVYVGCPHA